MQNKILLLVIYTENKPSANYKQKWCKIIINNYQHYIYRFHYKGNVLAEPLKIARESPKSAEHGLNNIAL
jgi:hypothetical protein